MSKKRLPAAISLLMALLTPLLSALFLIGIAFGERINRELDEGRALHTAEELLLVQYSRDLWKDFGLWGYEAAQVSLEEAQTLLQDSKTSLEFTAVQPLYGSGEVKKQILRYMKLRAPVLFSKEALGRIQEAARGREALGYGTMLATIRKQHENQGADQKYASAKEWIAELESEQEGGDVFSVQNLDEVQTLPDANADHSSASPPQASLEDALPNAGTPLGEVLSPDVVESLGNSGEVASSSEDLRFLTAFLASFSRKIQAVYQAAGTEDSRQEAYAPAAIENLAAALDRLLDTGLGMESERLSMAEYALLHCPGTVFFERQATRQAELLSSDGRPFRELAKERPAELEQLCSGLSSVGLATRWTEALLLGMRFIPRYIAAGNDPALQARYQTWARILSRALSVLSLGSASVPPEAIRYCIQAAHALYLAGGDVRTLKKGEGLPFWPDHSAQLVVRGLQNLPFYYRDYIRLILLSLPSDTLASRLEKMIQKQYPGPFYTAAVVRLLSQKRTYQEKIAYYREAADAAE